ncbi:MAG TPA: HAD-IA family hydrolase [Nevskiales bacterium]|nr:HAD-IA family hydrolase [Nevskiales bacterium]
MALQALLFDVDGTLADTEPQGHLPAYNEAFRELGLNWRWSPELYRELLLLPGGKERIAQYLRQYDPAVGEHRAEIERDAKAWVERVHKIKSRYFRRLVSGGKVTLRPGVRRLITEADQAGLRMAIVTNASRSSLEPFLEYTLGKELSERIDFIVSGEQVAHKKPAPDLYRLALLKLGLKPLECMALEDSSMGLVAATSAGIPTLITVNEDTRHHVFEDAVLVVDKLGEPDDPFRVLQGEPGTDRYVTLRLLQELLQRVESESNAEEAAEEEE